MTSPVYLDCNATTPLEPAVRDLVLRYLDDEYGNEGSRTHEHGARAKQAAQRARDQVATLAGCAREEVLFTSGATESNNLAILGLAGFGERAGRRHILSTRIEHKAVLGPLEEMARRGFEVDLLEPTPGGWIEPERIAAALRPDTLLVSVMSANNETGVIQPIPEIAATLAGRDAFFHVDAAQSFGKRIAELRDPRIDLLSVSAHKLYAPKGIGALIARRRGYDRVPLAPLLFGGGQERGLRPGTLPVALVAGFGLACEMALRDAETRAERCAAYRRRVFDALAPLDPNWTGDQARVLSHVANLAFPGIDSEALMVALKDLVAISNGSACTSSSYEPSHVLKAMGMSDAQATACVRISWCHMTPETDWDAVSARIRALM